MVILQKKNPLTGLINKSPRDILSCLQGPSGTAKPIWPATWLHLLIHRYFAIKGPEPSSADDGESESTAIDPALRRPGRRD